MNAIDTIALEASREIAQKESRNLHQKNDSGERVVGTKKSGGRNSDATEVFGYHCPCGYEIYKKNDEKAFERIMRLHNKVCKHPNKTEPMIQNRVEVAPKGVVRHDTFYDVVRSFPDVFPNEFSKK